MALPHLVSPLSLLTLDTTGNLSSVKILYLMMMFDCILLIIMLFLNICMVTACQAHLHLDDFVDPRWRVQHVCTVLLYVYCDVLMFVALKYKWVSKGKHVNLDPEWSLNDKADVSPGTYFFCVCVSGSDWVARKDRMTQQRGNQSIPQTQLSTCTRKHWEQIMPIQSSCFFCRVQAGRKRRQWLECHPIENWT